MWNILWTFILILFGIFINSSISYNMYQIMYNQYTKVNALIAMKKQFNIKLSFNMFYTAIKLIWMMCWLMISQWLNKNIEMIGKNKYSVSFIIGGKIYKMIIKHTLGPSKILQVIDSDDNDVTAHIEPYLLLEKHDTKLIEIYDKEITVMYSDGNDKTVELSNMI